MSIASLKALGVLVEIDGDELLIDAPAGVLTADLVALIRASKAALLGELRQRACDPPATTHGTGTDTRGNPLAPLVRCGGCANFQPNRDNPEAGIGTCQLGEPDAGGWPYFPGCVRCCDSFEAINNPTEVTHA